MCNAQSGDWFAFFYGQKYTIAILDAWCDGFVMMTDLFGKQKLYNMAHMREVVNFNLTCIENSCYN